jgi:hypothetical protein
MSVKNKPGACTVIATYRITRLRCLIYISTVQTSLQSLQISLQTISTDEGEFSKQETKSTENVKVVRIASTPLSLTGGAGIRSGERDALSFTVSTTSFLSLLVSQLPAIHCSVLC